MKLPVLKAIIYIQTQSCSLERIDILHLLEINHCLVLVPGVSAVIVDPELTLALALSHRTLRVRPRAAAVGVEASRAQHRHRAQLGQALEAPAVSIKESIEDSVTEQSWRPGIRDENLILVTLDGTAVILSTVRHVGGNFSAVKRLKHKESGGTSSSGEKQN